MAEQVITLPEADPSEKAVHIRVDGPIPPPAFIKIVDEDEATHTYIPESEHERVKAERDALLEAVNLVLHDDWEHTRDCLKDEWQPYFISAAGTFLEPAIDGDEGNNWANRVALLEAVRALAKAEAREKGDG